jgi:CBS domain containing-hemolysin-like protein
MAWEFFAGSARSDLAADPGSDPASLLVEKEELRQAADHSHEASDQEIDTFIDEATEEGIIEKDQNELLRASSSLETGPSGKS